MIWQFNSDNLNPLSKTLSNQAFLQVLLYFAVDNAHPCLWPKLSGKKIFCFNFSIQLFIYLHLDTYFLYYKGILAFIYEHIMVQEILCNNYKTQEQVQGI